MMKSKSTLVLCAALPVVLGAGTAFYHNRVIAACLDPQTGLLQHGLSGKFTPFFLVAGVCALLCLALAFWGKRAELAFGLRETTAAEKTVRTVASLLLLVAAALMLLQSDKMTALVILKAIFLAVCGGTSIAFIKAESLQSKGMCSLFPLFFMSLYLLSFYRDSARNPLTVTFAFEILSVICLMIALYLSSAVWFEKKRPAALLFFTLLATFGLSEALVGFALNGAFYRHYLPVGPADAIMALSLLILLWTDVFVAIRPLPPQPVAEPVATEPPVPEDEEEPTE